MSNRPTIQSGNDDVVTEAFLDLMSKTLNAGDLCGELPANVISLAKSRNLSLIDVNEVIKGKVEI